MRNYVKRQFPPEQRLVHRTAVVERRAFREADSPGEHGLQREVRSLELPLVERVHPDLGRLGVFWHTQGSGKSYSMAFFAEKVRRVVPGNFTFLVMTDREELDDQIYKTFVGTGICNEKTPRASSAK